MATRITKWVDAEALPPRSLHAFDFAVVGLADGSWLTAPVHVAVGNRPRPRLVALAGIHGDEPEGMLSLLDFWGTCDPGRLDGTVILVPVANPCAFAAHQRRSPLDGLDLNRLLQHLGILPGTPPPNPAPELYARGQLFAPAGGMLRLAVSHGDYVEAGALLATITDLHGEPVAEMRAPHAGLVAAVRHYVSVNPGDHVFAFFRPLTEKAAA